MPRPPLPVVGSDSQGVWGTKSNALWTDAHTSLDALTPLTDASINAAATTINANIATRTPYVSSSGYATLALALAAAGGGTLAIKRGTYTISAPLTPAANTHIEIEPGTTITQTTKYTPVFDCINVDDVVIHCNNALMQWTGSRAYTFAGGSVRGDDPYSYGAAIWSNGNRNRFYDVRAAGFTCGVYLSSWNGTTLANYAKENNEVHGVIADNVDFGVLFGGQVNPVIRNIRGSYSLQTGSGNPPHLIYVTKTGRNRNVDIDGARALNGTNGTAYVLKGVDGGKALNLHAHNCTGLLNVDSCNDMEVNISAASDLGVAEEGSITIFGTTTRCAIDTHIAAADSTTGYRLVSFDTTVSDTIVRLRGRQRQPANNANMAVALRGTRNTVEYAVNNLDNAGAIYTSGRPAVWAFGGSDHTIRMLEARGVAQAVIVDAGITNCVVEINAPHISSYLTGAVLLISEPTTILRRDGLAEYTAPTVGQLIAPDITRHSTIVVNVTNANNFWMDGYYGAVMRGDRVTVQIARNTATMGTVTWYTGTVAGSWNLRSAWTNPANGFTATVEFQFNGTQFVEMYRVVV